MDASLLDVKSTRAQKDRLHLQPSISENIYTVYTWSTHPHPACVYVVCVPFEAVRACCRVSVPQGAPKMLSVCGASQTRIKYSCLVVCLPFIFHCLRWLDTRKHRGRPARVQCLITSLPYIIWRVHMQFERCRRCAVNPEDGSALPKH